jgi:hypothetical protein
MSFVDTIAYGIIIPMIAAILLYFFFMLFIAFGNEDSIRSKFDKKKQSGRVGNSADAKDTKTVSDEV